MVEFKGRVALAVLVSIITVLGLAAAVIVFSPQVPKGTTVACPENTGSACSTYQITFAIAINYSGPWTVTYHQENSGLGNLSPPKVQGGFNGTGSFSEGIVLSGPRNTEVTLCATAQKLDGSGSTLSLTINQDTGEETSAPNGSVSDCWGTSP